MIFDGGREKRRIEVTIKVSPSVSLRLTASSSEGAIRNVADKNRRGVYRTSAKYSRTQQADGQWPPLRQRNRFPCLLAPLPKGSWHGVSHD